jgi:hypothetical protein
MYPPRRFLGQGQTAPISWQDVIAQAISTTGQILRPQTYQSPVPVYNPAATAVTQAAQSPGLWIAAAVVVGVLLLGKRR